MKPAWRILLIGCTLLGAWLGMQAIHESGHVLGAFLTGGTVERVVLHPLAISRTDVAENPHPLIVVWAGPLVGILFPLLAWGIAVATHYSGAFVLRFFAGFCLLANGLYIGVGSFDRVGDSGEILRLGSPAWPCWTFGLITSPLGLWMWHGQGSQFGLGQGDQEVNRSVATTVAAVCIALLVLGLVIDGK